MPKYVFQKHAARRLHYDLRLEHRGVLLSWAVPKGPSLDPKTKRLAVQVGDHSLEHGDFEGKLEKGAVQIWDRGTWEPAPERDVDRDLARGRLVFVLHGEKLRGRWNLVRTARTNQWLLFKGADDEARRDGSITDDRPKSVVSGRTLEEIAN